MTLTVSSSEGADAAYRRSDRYKDNGIVRALRRDKIRINLLLMRKDNRYLKNVKSCRGRRNPKLFQDDVMMV